MLPALLSRVPASDWILTAFILACAGWVLLAELLPGRRDDDDSDTPARRDGALTLMT